MALAPSIIINLPAQPFNNMASSDTLATLRAIASGALIQGSNIVVDGTIAVADGGGGLFTWNDLSVANDNSDSVIKPNDTAPLAAGRWVKVSAQSVIGSSTIPQINSSGLASSAVSSGVTSMLLGLAGSGGSNGIGFNGKLVGGGGSGATFLFDVVGGSIVSIYGIQGGANYTSAPTPIFDASSGLIGASATVTIGANFSVQYDGNTWLLRDYAPLAAQVAADLNRAIYVRSSSDLTKAWVRQYSGAVQLQWFGFASSNTAAINSAAFIALYSLMRTGAFVNIEANGLGLLLWDGGVCFGAVADVDIPLERWKVTRTQFQNVYNWNVSAYQFDKMSHWTVTRRDAVDILKLTLNTVGRFIESVSVGSKAVTFKTSSNPAYTLPYSYPSDTFAVGSWALVASVNNQPGPTFPQCLNNFDFVKIKTIGAGGMTFERSLRYNHLSTSVDMWSSAWASGVVPSGKARVWNLEQFDKWDIEREYDGLDLVFTPFPYSGPQAYINFWGRKVTYRNCRLPGFGMSLCDEYSLYDCVVYFNGEGDKMNRKLRAVRTVFEDSFNITNSGVETFHATDCTFHKGSKLFGIDTNSAKYSLVETSYIEGLNTRAGLGVSLAKVYDRCTITAVDNATFGYFADVAIPISAGVTYASGVFTITYAAALPNIAAYTTLQYAVVEGCNINFAGPADIFTGDAFSGRVLSVTETGPVGSPNYVITTDMPFATIPTASLGIGAATPKIRIQRDAEIQFINCTGCNEVRVASEAYRRGLASHELRDATFMGKCAQVTSLFSIGTIEKIIVEVIKPKQTAGTVSMQFQSYLASDFGIAPKTLTLGIDLTAKGVRSFDTTALTGKKAGDTVTFDGSAVTAIPVDRWTNQNHFIVFSYDPMLGVQSDLPRIRVSVVTSTGESRELAMFYKDAGGNLVAAVAGGLQ